jgi:hypothetical protein
MSERIPTFDKYLSNTYYKALHECGNLKEIKDLSLERQKGDLNRNLFK